MTTKWQLNKAMLLLAVLSSSRAIIYRQNTATRRSSGYYFGSSRQFSKHFIWMLCNLFIMERKMVSVSCESGPLMWNCLLCTYLEREKIMINEISIGLFEVWERDVEATQKSPEKKSNTALRHNFTLTTSFTILDLDYNRNLSWFISHSLSIRFHSSDLYTR